MHPALALQTDHLLLVARHSATAAAACAHGRQPLHTCGAAALALQDDNFLLLPLGRHAVAVWDGAAAAGGIRGGPAGRDGRTLAEASRTLGEVSRQAQVLGASVAALLRGAWNHQDS